MQLRADHEGFGSQATLSYRSAVTAAEVTDAPAIDFGGHTLSTATIQRSWTFSGDSVASFDLASQSDSSTRGSGAMSNLALESTASFTFQDGKTARGVHSEDGDLLAWVKAADNGGATVSVGGNAWTSGDIDQTFNYVRFEGYVDQPGRGFVPGQAGLTTVQKGDASFNCAGGI